MAKQQEVKSFEVREREIHLKALPALLSATQSLHSSRKSLISSIWRHKNIFSWTRSEIKIFWAHFSFVTKYLFFFPDGFSSLLFFHPFCYRWQQKKNMKSPSNYYCYIAFCCWWRIKKMSWFSLVLRNYRIVVKIALQALVNFESCSFHFRLFSSRFKQQAIEDIWRNIWWCMVWCEMKGNSFFFVE